MTYRRFLPAALSLLLATSNAAQASQAEAGADGVTAIVGADLLPMTGTDRLEDQTILVSDGRILEVGPRSEIRVPADARSIDGRGKTVMPGLVDMHVHLAPTPGAPGDPAQRAMAVMLGHGVTTARSMAGAPQTLEVRKAVEADTLPGPRLYAASPALNFQNTQTAEAGRRAVAEADAAGYDLVKAHHLPEVAVWQTIQDEAKKRLIPTAGHVANEVGLDRALAAGQQIEHLDSFIYELLPEDAPERQIEFGQVPPPAVVQAASSVSDDRLEAIARRVAAAKAYQVPTLSLFERISDVTAPIEKLLAMPEMRFVPEPVLQQWAAQREGFAQQTGFDAETAEMFRQLRRRIVAALHKAGAPIMAGSDTAQAFHIWGPATISEIEALHSAGLSRMEALRSATVVPRNYLRSLPGQGSALGWRPDFGVIEKGARADLIVLAGDPSLDLSALHRLEIVIAGGRVYDRVALDRLLDAAAKAAKGGQSASAAAANSQQVYVMRHLEAANGRDPSLSAKGKADSQRLAVFLSEAGIEAVFVTPTRRAQETVMPLAERLGLAPMLYDPADPAKLAEAANRVAGNVLIIGHSNTIIEIVSWLGGQAPAPISHDDFGTLWRVDHGAALTRAFALNGPKPAVLYACTHPGFPAGSLCGNVSVPENREVTGGRTLDIHFAVVPASKDSITCGCSPSVSDRR